jgi:hypothetical protein
MIASLKRSENNDPAQGDFVSERVRSRASGS